MRKAQGPHRDPRGPTRAARRLPSQGHTASLLLSAYATPGPSSEPYSRGTLGTSPLSPASGSLSQRHLFGEALADHLRHSGSRCHAPPHGTGFRVGLVGPDTGSNVYGLLCPPLPLENVSSAKRGFRLPWFTPASSVPRTVPGTDKAQQTCVKCMNSYLKKSTRWLNN